MSGVGQRKWSRRDSRRGRMAVMKPCDNATYERICARQPVRSDELIGVTSTRIVCRIGCTARTPLQRNIVLVETLSEAVAAGFRPCKRCRPDRFGLLPDSQAALDVAAGFATLAADPATASVGVSGIARRLHVSDRQLRRIVRAHFNTTPSEYLRVQRTAVA